LKSWAHLLMLFVRLKKTCLLPKRLQVRFLRWPLSTNAAYLFTKTSRDNANFRGSVKYYKHHLFVCHGSDPSTWPSHIDKIGGFVTELINAANTLNIPPRVNLCDQPSTGDGSSFDILYFSSNHRQNSLFRNVNLSNISSLVGVLKKESTLETSSYECADIQRETMSPQRWIFVCCHHARDERCGRCGPPLVVAFVPIVSLGHFSLRCPLSPIRIRYFFFVIWSIHC
jgi:hypothetical protein